MSDLLNVVVGFKVSVSSQQHSDTIQLSIVLLYTQYPRLRRNRGLLHKTLSTEKLPLLFPLFDSLPYPRALITRLYSAPTHVSTHFTAEHAQCLASRPTSSFHLFFWLRTRIPFDATCSFPSSSGLPNIVSCNLSLSFPSLLCYSTAFDIYVAWLS
jgi:hypothetical protein